MIGAGSQGTPDRQVQPVGERIAVIGSGVAGLVAAHVLSGRHSVTLFEADQRLGGHAHTHDVPGPGGIGTLAVDSGFIVHNDRTYPLLRRLFTELGIAVHRTEMSMSIRQEATGLEYAGGRGLPGFLARPRQLLDRDYLRTLAAVRRFHGLARDFIAETDDLDPTTYAEFIAAAGLPAAFTELYAIPLVACVWSTGTTHALDYPARYLFRFLEHHGMLSIGDSPRWYTVAGGSRRYVEAVAAGLAEVRLASPVQQIRRYADHVEVVTQSVERFERVVIATHPDDALRLLADATPDEQAVLGAFRYSANEAVLHRDPSLMPRSPRARASWNYLIRAEGQSAPVVTYWMNRLQGLPEQRPTFVTLNARDRIDPKAIDAVMQYAHPVYDLAAVRAQRRLPELNTARTAYAGAYHGWGFHEDGARAGVAAAASFGVAW